MHFFLNQMNYSCSLISVIFIMGYHNDLEKRRVLWTGTLVHSFGIDEPVPRDSFIYLSGFILFFYIFSYLVF